jgi:hypothetical protein
MTNGLPCKRRERGRGLWRVLDPPAPGADEPPVVDDQVRDRDEGANRDRATGALVLADPRERRYERRRVGGDVANQGPPRGVIVAEPSALVLRLPVRLKQDVTCGMGDEERDESRRPAHAVAPNATPLDDQRATSTRSRLPGPAPTRL